MSANQDIAPMGEELNRLQRGARRLSCAALIGIQLGVLLALGEAGATSSLPSPTLRNPLIRPVAVFGSDQRVSVPQSHRAITAKIGVIYDSRSHSICTAFCLAPGVVATAAHCLYRTSGETPPRLSGFSVRLDGESAVSGIAGAQQGAAEANVLVGSTRLNVQPPIDATRDWALVRLARPLCARGTLKLSPRPIAEVVRIAAAGRVYNIAYHRDLPKWKPWLGRPCDVQRSFKGADRRTIRRDFTDPGQLLLHTCDTGGASSGSPLLIDGPNGPEVVGINVGTYVQSKVIMLNDEVLHRFKSDNIANTAVSALAFTAALKTFASADILSNRSDITRLQQGLAAKELYKGPKDGRFVPDLRIAIETFERTSGMPVTGLATRSLLNALLGDSDVVTGSTSAQRRAGPAASHRRPLSSAPTRP